MFEQVFIYLGVAWSPAWGVYRFVTKLIKRYEKIDIKSRRANDVFSRSDKMKLETTLAHFRQKLTNVISSASID